MSFREWTTQLRSIKGSRPLWPALLGVILDEEFERLANVDETYASEVFKIRDDTTPVKGTTERRMVASLFHHCLRENQGCLTFNSESIWLLGYEWPNQGGDKERGRRADLVGLRSDGSLVVFECKRRDNSDPPLIALIEGLDYLACLMRPQNFKKIEDGFSKWLGKPAKVIPSGFENVRPDRSCRPSLVVMAPEEYFLGRYSRSRRGEGWREIADAGTQCVQKFSLSFAACDFQSPLATNLHTGPNNDTK